MTLHAPIRVGFISHSSGLRGAERALLEAIEALRPYPVHPHIFVPSAGPMTDQLDALRVDYSCYRSLPWVRTTQHRGKSSMKLLLMMPLTLLLTYRIKQQHCQLIYSNTIAVPLGALAASLLNLPHIWHIHEFGKEDHGFLFDSGDCFAQWFLKRYGGFFIFNSYAVADKFERFLRTHSSPAGSQVIYQSVTIPTSGKNVQRTFETQKDRITILLAGALHERKGQRDAILAMKALHEKGLHPYLILAGDGPDKKPLAEMIQNLNLMEQVKFTGFLEDLSEYYRQADIVLVCSRKEAFGRVALESMLYQKPVIAAESGGLKELIQKNVTGVFYTPGNPADLANKIEMLVNDWRHAAQIARNGYRWASANFTQQRYGKELYKVLTHCKRSS